MENQTLQTLVSVVYVFTLSHFLTSCCTFCTTGSGVLLHPRATCSRRVWHLSTSQPQIASLQSRHTLRYCELRFLLYNFWPTENPRALQTEGDFPRCFHSGGVCLSCTCTVKTNQKYTSLVIFWLCSNLINGKEIMENTSQYIGWPQSHHGNMINIFFAISQKKKQIKWVTNPHFSFLYPFCISNMYAKENKWARKLWVGLCYGFTFWLCSCEIKLVEEKVSWGGSRPVSIRWVILCVSSGCSGPKRPVCILAANIGQTFVGEEKGKSTVHWIHPLACDRCVYVCLFCYLFSLPKVLFAEVPGGTVRWLDKYSVLRVPNYLSD